MSAFVGIVRFDGGAIDESVLDQATRRLARIGPDGHRHHLLGNAGFGHALLRTAPANGSAGQPLVIDGEVMVVGDVRLDTAEELRTRLGKTAGEPRLSDIELVAQAWRRWGERCTDFLRGDFALAVWEQRGGRLFAVRDQLGVRPLYYHRGRDWLAFSNALNVLRDLPGVGTELDCNSIADFLLCDHITDPSATSFRAIRQLPPGHRVTFDHAGGTPRRYWRLPEEEPLRFRDNAECVEAFRHHLERAVETRLASPRASILVSGGMDSTSVTVTALDCRRRQGIDPGLQLFSVRATDSDEDQDLDFARDLARRLGLPLEAIEEDSAVLFQAAEAAGWPAPEPQFQAQHELARRYLGALASHAPTALTGQGGDPALAASHGWLTGLLRSGQVWRFMRESAAFVRMHRKRPPLGLHKALRARFGQTSEAIALPPWINPDLAREQKLAERLTEYYGRLQQTDAADASRPEARLKLTSPYWQRVLGGHDPQATGLPVEFRHPFFDVGLLEFLLRVPPRWFHDKALLRAAMVGRLPEAIRRRPKALFRVAPIKQAILNLAPAAWDELRSLPLQAAAYVDPKSYATISSDVRRLKSMEVLGLTGPIKLVQWALSQNSPDLLGELDR